MTRLLLCQNDCPFRGSFWQNRIGIVPGRPGTGRDSLSKIPSRPVPWQDFELVPLSLCPGTIKKDLSRCPENWLCPVPLETLVSKGRDIPGQTGTGRPVVPLSRDKKNSCPGVPLSRDKGRSKCPGTNSSVPGHPGTKSPPKNQEKDVLIQKKGVLKQETDVLKQKKMF